MELIPDLRESEVVRDSKMRVHEEHEVIKIRLKKLYDDGEIQDLKDLKTKLRAMIDGTVNGPFTAYESKYFERLEKKYKYHPDYLMW